MGVALLEPRGIPSVASIGECMIELREMPDGRLTRGYGGDVLNTAIYLSRLLKKKAEVRFSTIMGDDPFSTEMIAAWKKEGLVCDTIGRKKSSNVGLYLIQTDDTAERSFHYWRDHAPARQMMDPDWTPTLEKTFASSWIYLSGITLAILGDIGRKRLFTRLESAKQKGATIVFDGNFRPALWPDRRKALAWYKRLWKHSSIALASAEDEAVLFGDTSSEATLKRLCNYNIPEIIVKCGQNPLLLANSEKSKSVPVQPVNDIIDTTAAGDSFNAGYISARIHGLEPTDATHLGAKLAARVIQHPGAIIPLSAMPDIQLPT